MGLFSQKIDAISQLKVATALGSELTSGFDQLTSLKNTGSLASLNPSNKDAIEYAIDLITLLFGADFLQNTVNKVMKKVFQKSASGEIILEKKLKASLLDSLCGNEGKKVIPLDFTSTGYAVPVKALDLFDLFKLNPAGPSESRLFGSANSFERNFLSQVLQSASPLPAPSTFTSLPNIGFNFSLAQNVVTLTAASNITPTTTVESFFKTILYAPGFQLINPQAIALEVLDVIMGFLSPRRTLRAIANEECLRDLVGKIGNEVAVEEVFTFNPKALQDIDARAAKRKQGGYSLDLGCEVKNVKIVEETITDTIDTQPDYAAMFTSALETQLSSDDTTLNDATRENFQRGILKALIMVLLKHTLLNPRVWTLFILSKIFTVGYPQSKFGNTVLTTGSKVDIHDILENRKGLVATITDTVRQSIMGFVTQILIKKIISLVGPLVAQKELELAKSYLNIIQSLVKIP